MFWRTCLREEETNGHRAGGAGNRACMGADYCTRVCMYAPLFVQEPVRMLAPREKNRAGVVSHVRGGLGYTLLMPVVEHGLTWRCRDDGQQNVQA